MPYSVCVYCGSRYGNSDAFGRAAAALGTWLAKNDMRLVYGAGDIGLMGELARAAQAAGGTTLGVIPAHLQKTEIGKTDLTQYIVTETMHERKKVMFMNADAVIALPGGAGTLDELFEVLTWRQLGLHTKPVFLLNTEGYWDDLVALIKGVCAKGFAPDSLRDYFQLVGTVGDLATRLRSVRQLSQV